jgi:ATP-binding cassette subfamily F protein 3
VLQLQGISKVFPHGEPLTDVSWELKAGDRVGVVGANGTGKTTLFRIIAGEIEPTAGQIVRKPGLKIAVLTQEFDVLPDNTLEDELLRAFVEVDETNRKLHEVQHRLESCSIAETDSLLKDLDRLQRRFDALGGYDIHRRIDKLIPTIGFSPQDGQRLVKTFSLGWQMRIAIGKVMLQEPDIMLLDEPTNHIDVETIEWLETYLKQLTCPMAIISHDRMFLDRVCTKIIEIERGVATEYLGNYSAYIAAKEIERETQLAAFERQQRELERQSEFIERFRASATRSTQAKSREKQLDKIDLIDEPESELRTLQFEFPPCKRSGREVVRIKNVMHAYDDNIIYLDANLLIERGDRIALLGPNGSGKSTLLRLIAGEEEASSGEVQLGEHNIEPAYFAQNQAEALDLEKTVLETIADQVPEWKDAKIRTLLGCFLFGGDTVFKQVKLISGGEKARLALAKMLLRSANFLILDEPTNHLDIPAKEMLEEALQKYEGAAIVVSHDRYFLAQVATKIVEVKDGALKLYNGNYDYYLQKIDQEQQAKLAAAQEAERQAQLAAKRAKQMEKERLKKEKERLEKEKKRLEKKAKDDADS